MFTHTQSGPMRVGGKPPATAAAAASSRLDGSERHSSSEQYIVRGLVCLGSAFILVVAAFSFAIGLYACLPPVYWLPGIYTRHDGDAHANTIVWASSIVGLVVVLCSCAGCVAAWKRKKSMAACFCLIVFVGFVFVCAGAAALWTLDGALAEAQQSHFNIGRLSEKHANVFRTLYVEFAAIYHFCAPTNANSVWAPLAFGRTVQTPIRVECGEASLAPFGRWATKMCVSDLAVWPAATLEMVTSCRTGLNLTGVPLKEDPSWLFCACAPSMSEMLRRWLTPARILAAMLAAYLLLLQGLLCLLCKVFIPAHPSHSPQLPMSALRVSLTPHVNRPSLALLRL